ncbi:MAG: ABC transporter substrate-binding protein [Clostridiales bacterium]|nr:ABC transporter substrate-binding protein [Clostridiales bacterium]
MKKSRIIALALTMLMIVSILAGCGGTTGTAGAASTAAAAPATTAAEATTAAPAAEATTETAAGPSEIRIGLIPDPGDLAPFSAPSWGRVSTIKSIYETLVDQDKFGGEMVGVLMKEYKKIGELEYEMTLYDNIVDSAGNHLTAKDIDFCYNTALKLGNLSKLNQIESIKATGDYTVNFKFKKLQVGDLAVLWSECPIVTQAAYEASKDTMSTDPVCTAPYIVTGYVTGNSLTLEKNPKYWQTDASKINTYSQANVDKIVYTIIPESSQQTIALETGKIDLSAFIGATDLPGFQSNKDFTVSQAGQNLTDLLAFNCYTGSMFENKDLRQALEYAIDGNAIVAGALSGQGVASKIPGNAKYPDYNKAWDAKNYYAYDAAKAKELLAKAGYKEGELTIRLMSASDPTHVAEAQVIQALLQEIGVTVKIDSYDGPLYNTYKIDPTKYDMIINQAASTDYLVNVWKLIWDNTAYKYGDSNFHKDDKLQELLMTACSMDGYTQANVDALVDYEMNQCYCIGLAQEMDNFVHTNKITKLVFDCKGFVVPGACEYAK